MTLSSPWFRILLPIFMKVRSPSLNVEFYFSTAQHLGINDCISPHSIISRFEFKNPREKAEQILELFISTLAIPTHHVKFVAALPLIRICLLLLGDRPSPLVATQLLRLIGISIDTSSSFSRKFELVGGLECFDHCFAFELGPSC
jgi:hypothetical protein